MNLLLLFAAVAAVASIVGLLKSSLRWRWQAVLSLGVIVATATIIALLLDHFTSLTSFEWAGEQTPTGLPLYLSGPSDSILGKGYGFVFIAFLWSIGLIAAAFIMKRRKMSSITESEMDGKEPTEAECINNRLKEEIYTERGDFDPMQAGEDDATRDGGPFPQENDVEPQGYESGVRTRFEALGNRFLAATVTRLREELTNALMGLESIRERVVRLPYMELARGSYDANRVEIAPYEVLEKCRTYIRTTQKRTEFINSLRLRNAEQPDWGKRTTLKKLIIWGAIFALLEFAVSWFLLKGEIGDRALKIAAIAVVIIFISAFLAGSLFQFMRRNQPLHTRALAFIGYLGAGFVLFVGFGLLLNYRAVLDSIRGNEAIASKFDVILDGYTLIMNDPINLGIFLINLVALIFFYWKILHYFDKFYGYSDVNNPFLDARAAFRGMHTEAERSITDALEDTSDEASGDKIKAGKHFGNIQRKKGALENIRETITAAYQGILHQAYKKDVSAYRESNRNSRVTEVAPVPQYFNDDPPICDIEEHFEQVGDIGHFLAQSQERLEQAEEKLGAICEEYERWRADLPNLRRELTLEFEEMIADARTGGGAEAAPPQGSGQHETAS